MKALLIFRSAALGDFILATPALNEVRKNFPDRKIVFLTTQSTHKSQRIKVSKYAGTTNRIPWVNLAVPHLIDHVCVLDDFNFSSLWKMRSELSTFDFETAILMVDPCAPWLGRIKKIFLIYFLVGFLPTLGWRSRGSLRGNRLELKKSGLLTHHIHGPLHFLSELNPPRKYQEQDILFDLRPGHEAENWTSNWIYDNHLSNNRLVAIAPGSVQPHKRWPQKYFSELISSVLKKYNDVAILILGTPEDKALGESLKSLAPSKIHNLAGITSIVQSAALLKKCSLLVGNDGGAIHLGDAMGCKVISIIPGIEYPDSIEPWHNKDLVIRYPVPCAPCYCFTHCPEKHNRCMADLPATLVINKCESILG